MTTRRASANIYDYPEHLNPFYEEDNHNKLRFWNVPKKKRSTSFSFQSVKDFKSNLKLRRYRSRSGTTCSMFTTSNNLLIGHKFDTASRTEHGRKFLVFPKLLQIGRTFSIRKNKNDAPVCEPNQSSPKIEREKVQYQSPNPMKRFTINPKKQQSNYETVHTLPNPRLHEHRCDGNGDRVQPDSPSKSPVPNADRNPFDDERHQASAASVSPSSKPRTPPRKKKRAPPPPPVRQSSLIKDSTEGTSNESVNEQQNEQNTEENKRDSISTSNSENSEQNVQKIEETVKITVTASTFNKNEESNSLSNKITDENTITDSVKITKCNANNIEKTEEIQITEVIVLATEPNSSSIQKEDNSVCTQENENKIEAVSETKITQSEEELKQDSDDAEKEDVSENFEKTDNVEKIEITSESAAGVVVESTNFEESETEIKDLETDAITIPDQLIYNSELTISGSNTSLSSDVQLEQKQQQLAIDDSQDLLEMVQKLQLEVQKLTDDTNNNVIPTSPKIKTEMTVQLEPDFPTAPLSPRFIRLRKDNAWIKRYE